MRRLKFSVALALCLVAGRATAVFEDIADSAANAQSRVDGELRAASPETVVFQEAERQEAARKRVDKIRHLRPDKIQDWLDGKLSEEDLDRFYVPDAESDGESEMKVPIPRGRLIRLELCGILVVCLAGVVWHRRRREQVAQTAGKRRS